MDNLKYLSARERRIRKIGGHRSCEVCGEPNPFVLNSHGGRWLCYEHRPGGHATEVHHIAGLHRGATVTLPANAHRALTAKFETMLPSRFRDRGRSVEEEMVAMTVGATLASDYFVNDATSPYRSMHVPRQQGRVTLRGQDFHMIRQRHSSGVELELLFLSVSVDD